VLVGLEIPVGDTARLREFLDRLGYRYEDESDNPVYKLFL
jgi:threonine dehydratase